MLYQIMYENIKVRLFLDRSCAILSSFKIVVIFNNTSANFVLISADVLLKMTTILKELRIAQLRSKNKRTLVDVTSKDINSFLRSFSPRDQNFLRLVCTCFSSWIIFYTYWILSKFYQCIRNTNNFPCAYS